MPRRGYRFIAAVEVVAEPEAVALVALRRLGTVEDCAKVVEFLVTDLSDYVTGAVIPIDGGLVDGPVYGSIFNGLIGIQLKDADEYADFQSNLAVYHDDYGDYSTNEPTMDGTASLIYLLAALLAARFGVSESELFTI